MGLLAVHGSVSRWKKPFASSPGHWMDEDESRYTFSTYTLCIVSPSTDIEELGMIEDLVHENTTLEHLRYLLPSVFPDQRLSTAFCFKTASGRVSNQDCLFCNIICAHHVI
jgi:hypothetical protein